MMLSAEAAIPSVEDLAKEEAAKPTIGETNDYKSYSICTSLQPMECL